VDDAGFEVGLSVTRKKDGGALVLGPVDNQFCHGESRHRRIGAGIRLVTPIRESMSSRARAKKSHAHLEGQSVKQVLGRRSGESSSLSKPRQTRPGAFA